MALSKDQIVGSDDRKTESVPVPEWGGDVLLRTISGFDRDRFEDSLTTVTEDGDIKGNYLDADARLLVKCIVDDSGHRVFDDKDVPVLAGKNSAVLARLAKKARELNSLGLNEDEVKAVADEAGKDSEPDQNESSTSNSPKK